MLSKKELIEEAKKEFLKNRSIRFSVEWQIKRFGISENEANEKIKVMRAKYSTASKTKSVEWQMKRFNLTKEQAESKVLLAKKKYSETINGLSDFEKKAISPKNKEHWLKKGYTIDEAKDFAEKQVSSMQKVFQEKIKNNPEEYLDRCESQLDYWINRKGFTLEEAKLAVKERQKTFTLDKCIKKYGEKEGTKIWKERQEKWSKKIENLYKQGKFTKFCKNNWSNVEENFIRHLINKIGLNEENYFSCINGKQFFRHFKEFGQTFAYDFVLNKKIIEFNGDYWHCNPNFYNPEYFNASLQCTAQEKWDFDKFKNNCIKNKGYQVLTIWESEYKENPEKTIEKCINFLTS
jgi:hypothetical protein